MQRSRQLVRQWQTSTLWPHPALPSRVNQQLAATQGLQAIHDALQRSQPQRPAFYRSSADAVQ